MEPKLILETTQKGQRSVQAAFCLLEASWKPPGRLQGRKKVLWTRSWAVLAEFQDRFQRSWGPKVSQKRVQNEPKTKSKSDSS